MQLLLHSQLLRAMAHCSVGTSAQPCRTSQTGIGKPSLRTVPQREEEIIYPPSSLPSPVSHGQNAFCFEQFSRLHLLTPLVAAQRADPTSSGWHVVGVQQWWRTRDSRHAAGQSSCVTTDKRESSELLGKYLVSPRWQNAQIWLDMEAVIDFRRKASSRECVIKFIY